MDGESPLIGVLALQGDVREHVGILRGLGASVRLVRAPEHLQGVKGLVLPGGESTVMDKLLRAFDLQQPLRAAIGSGLPVYATCAGLILLADRVLDAAPGQQTLGGLDVEVRRNAFGRQAESFEAALEVEGIADGPIKASFIRAPEITAVGARAAAIATLPGGRVVGVAQGNILATSFHPEMNDVPRLHALLLQRAQRRR